MSEYTCVCVCVSVSVSVCLCVCVSCKEAIISDNNYALYMSLNIS